MELLIKAKSTIDIDNKAVSAYVNVCDYDNGWTSPLIEACREGHVNTTKLLLQRGADINVKVGLIAVGLTALLAAAKNSHFDVVKLLINKGVEFKGALQEIHSTLKKEETLNCIERHSLSLTVQLLIRTLFLQYPSEEPPDFLKADEELSTYWKNINSESVSLKEVTSGEVALFDFCTIEDINELVKMSCNKKIRDIITKGDFTGKYPHFGEKIKPLFSLSNKLFFHSVNVGLFSVYTIVDSNNFLLKR